LEIINDEVVWGASGVAVGVEVGEGDGVSEGVGDGATRVIDRGLDHVGELPVSVYLPIFRS